MPQKELTPHQVSKGLSYIHKEAPFLTRLKNKTQGQEEAKKRFANYEDGQDDADYDELDGAQVVELDDKGKEIHKDVGEKEEEPAIDEKEKEPAVDENGRLLFRKSGKNTKRKLQQVITEELSKVQPKKPKKQKKQASLLLSFDQDE